MVITQLEMLGVMMQTRDVEKATSEHKDLTYLWNLPSAPSAFLRTAHSSSSVCCGRRPRQAGLLIQEAYKRNDCPDIIMTIISANSLTKSVA